MVWSIIGAFLGTCFRIYWISFAAALIAIGIIWVGILTPSASKIHYHLKFLLIYLVSFSCAVFVSPLFLLQPRNVRNSRYSARFVRWTTGVLGVTYEVRNAELLREDRGAMLCLNHQSALDVVLLFILIPILRAATPIIKKELLYAVPYGPCTWLCGAYFVDRKSPKAAYRTLNHVASEMQNKKVKCYIFPEGTRNPNRGLLPFKRGAFKTAIMGQVPIIPIVISPYYFIDHKNKIFPKGHLICKALDPIPTKGMVDEDHEALMERTRNAMLVEYEKLAAEIDEMSVKQEWRDKPRPRLCEDEKTK